MPRDSTLGIFYGGSMKYVSLLIILCILFCSCTYPKTLDYRIELPQPKDILKETNKDFYVSVSWAYTPALSNAGEARLEMYKRLIQKFDADQIYIEERESGSMYIGIGIALLLSSDEIKQLGDKVWEQE